jgi:spermidine/putrescine transport system permease protein
MPTAEQVGKLRVRRELRRRWLLSAPALLTIMLAAVGPLAIVLLFSFMEKGDYGDVKYWHFSTDGWLGLIFERDPIDDTLGLATANVEIIWRSVKLSFLTTIFTALLGFPTAYVIATRSPRSRNTWLFLITIPFWTNLLIRTFAIQDLIRNEGLINLTLRKLGLIDAPIQLLFTDGAVLAGLTYVYFPLMVLPIYASLEKLDMRLVEAGYDLYASRLQVLRHIVLPHAAPGLIAGSILVFIPSIGAYVTPRVLGGGKNMMLGNLIEQQFGQARDWPFGSALSIALLVVVTLALLVYVRNASRGNGSHHGR